MVNIRICWTFMGTVREFKNITQAEANTLISFISDLQDREGEVGVIITVTG